MEVRQLTIGEFADALKNVAEQYSEAMLPHVEVVFDCGNIPTKLRSWRRNSWELTLDHNDDKDSNKLLKTLVREVEKAKTDMFETEWTSGKVRKMQPNTILWADNSESEVDCGPARAIVGVAMEVRRVVITTRVVEDQKIPSFPFSQVRTPFRYL